MLSLGPGALLAFLSLLPPALAEQQPAASNGELSFLTTRHTVWLERTQVVPFTMNEPAAADLRFTAMVSDAAVLAILEQPEILAGERVGFFRVQGLAEGVTELRIGDASLPVSVKKVNAPSPANQISLRIVSPVEGAAVWGSFSIGVEVRPGSGTEPFDSYAVRLRLADGTRLAPVAELGGERGPCRRLRFTLDASVLPPGQLELVAEAHLPSGSPARQAEGPIESNPVRLLVVEPTPSSLIHGECEDSVDAARPELFGLDSPRTGAHPTASGGMSVANNRTHPIWLFPHSVERAGRYQMMLVARGDFGAGAFPSVGFCVDDPNQARTSSRLVGQGWQRIPVGLPTTIEAGDHTLALRFLNDSQVSPSSDRNLFLDRFELLRLEEDGSLFPNLADASGDSMMMEGGSMNRRASRITEATDVWIGFSEVIDGLPLNGRVMLRGHCNWQDAASTPAPQVSLHINGEVVATQQAAKPLFIVDAEDLREGANALRMTAELPDGSVAETPEQTLWIRDRPDDLEPRDAHRFSVLDTRWNDALKAALSGQNQEVGHRVVHWSAGLEAELRLPEELQGEFRLFLDARGPEGGRFTELDLSLIVAGEEQPIGSARAQNWWSHRDAGRVTLEAGPKILRVVAGEVDHSAEPMLMLRDVILRTPRAQPDRAPPRARIVYPQNGHEAWHVDAVVVEAWDDEGLQSADVLIDGRPQGTYGRIREGAGYLCLPLMLRHVSPGEHELTLRVLDREGNVAEPASVSFTVTEAAPNEMGIYQRAIHLLNRLAYGPDPQELAAILMMGEEAWLAQRLAPESPGDAAARGLAEAVRGDHLYADINRSTLVHVLRTDNPVRTRFSFWADNHFSTWIGKTTNQAEWWEHWRFHDLGVAPFSELLTTSAMSPVMIYYLDQAESYAGRLNENYARELMELHTLGVDGGYDQEDVTTLAGLLCGLTLAFEAPADGEGGQLQGSLQFDPDLGDARERDLLGMRFPRRAPPARFDRLRRVLELLAAHPSTARHVARKLVEHYVAVPAPEPLVHDLSQIFLEEGGDMASMLTALVGHPSFWEHDEPRMTSPFEFGVRLGRTTERPEIDWALSGYLRRSGTSLHDHVTPDGYPQEDAAWTDTNGMLQRWRLVQEIPWAVRNLAADPVRNRTAGDQERWRQRVIDLIAVRLTGWTLGQESNQAALEFLAAEEGPSWQAVDRTAVLVCRLPEANMK